jgi:CDP-glucose 4,6-dehydratase
MKLKFFSGKKILLTGATGFKGSWLAIILKNLGAEVYDYSLAPASKEDNFVQCGLQKKIHSHYADIRDFKEFKSYITRVEPDVIFHLAAQSLVLRSYQEHLYTYETNLMGTVNLLEIIRETKFVKQAVFITTDKVYLNLEQNRYFKESDSLGGHDPYSSSKACAELAIQSATKSFFTNHPCKIASARAGNVIGGGDCAEYRIVPDIFRTIRNKTNLVLRNPLSIRPWQHVLEPLFGYLALAIKLDENPSLAQGAWNFGPEPAKVYSVKDLVDEIKTYYPDLTYETKDLDLGRESKILQLDINKSKSLLSWKPLLDFPETVRFTVEGYKADLCSQSEEELYSSRISQIEQYLEKMNAS